MQNNRLIKITDIATIEENYLEKYYTFKFEKNDQIDPDMIYKSIVSVLENCVKDGMIIDIDLIPKKAKIHCQYYSESGAIYIPFIITLFKIKTGQIVFEFQRIRGDANKFFNLYHKCLYELHKTGVINNPVSEKFKDSKFYPESNLDCTDYQAREILKPLSQMCKNKFIDVKIQALETLTELAFNPKFRKSIIELDFIKELIKCLSINSQDIQRLSLSSLKFLTNVEEGKKILLKEESFLGVLETIKTETTSLQIKRDIQVILDNLFKERKSN